MINNIKTMILDRNPCAFGFICLFVLRFNSPVNNLSVMLGWSHCFLGLNQYCEELMCLAQGHNMELPVGIEPRSSMLYHYATTLPSSAFGQKSMQSS